jgi:hypothetical protein
MHLRATYKKSEMGSLRHLAWRISVTAAMIGGALAQACSSGSGGPGPGEEGGSCVADPNTCPAGTTCWPTDCPDPKTCIPNLTCLPSTPGKAPHSSCENKLGAPTCSDHQACVQLGPSTGGCVVYCDDTRANHGCAEGESCVELRVGQPEQSPTIHVCIFIPPADGGTDALDDGGIDDAAFDVTLDTRI